MLLRARSLFNFMLSPREDEFSPEMSNGMAFVDRPFINVKVVTSSPLSLLQHNGCNFKVCSLSW